jgi:hypothetical protein
MGVKDVSFVPIWANALKDVRDRRWWLFKLRSREV